MHTLRVTTRIAAPPARCFDLARDVGVHLQSAAATGERVVDGPTSGLLSLGDVVTFEGRHLGVVRRLTSRITAFDPPFYFQDRMVAGPFRRFEHDHWFDPDAAGGTVMVDVVQFAAPCGVVGWVAERLIVGPHLRRFLVGRGHAIKTMAERDIPTVQ
jgi:ligand-binding SRPBCC domain-containing protein